MAADWLALAPAIVLGLTALVLLGIDSISPKSKQNTLLAGTALVGTVVSFGITAIYLASGMGTPYAVSLFDGQILVDGMALFFTLIFTSVTALVVVASHDYLADEAHQAEYYSLVMLAATGMSLMATANSLAVIFVSLELASLPSYALVSFLKTNKGSVEAGLKYFLIGALSSAIFAYGISLIYAASGHLQLTAVAAGLASEGLEGVLGVGVLMVIGGFAFKTASVPFHFWAPEAYEGAPAPISGFLSSASKAAGFAVAFRVFVTAFPMDAVGSAIDWILVFQVLALVTMTLGNFAAATQENVKRMLAYSSIGHAGYVLIALAALGGGHNDLVLGAGMVHLLVYGVMNTGAFLFIALAEYWGVGRTFEDFNGLAKQAPVACVSMTIFLFSLAGLPVGGGFLSKYYLLIGTVSAGVTWLGAALAINSALSLFYYTRVVKAMWIEEPTQDFEIERYPTGLYAAVVAAAILTVVLLPAFGIAWSQAFTAAASLV